MRAGVRQPDVRPPGAGRPAGVEPFAELLAGLTRRVERVLAAVAGVGAATAAIAAAARLAGRPLRRADLAALREPVAGVLREHAGLAAGAGVVLAPGALADAPRWIEWWRADQGPGLTRLEVDLDPDSAEFFDYTTTEWYQAPERTGRPAVAGPYVDYICTHEYTFTISVPVVTAGRFAGVAGVDILAGQVERLVLDGLSALGATAVLVGGNGRVIASNSASVRPGVPAARQPPCAGLVPVAGPAAAGPGRGPGPVLPWTLLAQPG
jgi:hypothetical protein